MMEKGNTLQYAAASADSAEPAIASAFNLLL